MDWKTLKCDYYWKTMCFLRTYENPESSVSSRSQPLPWCHNPLFMKVVKLKQRPHPCRAQAPVACVLVVKYTRASGSHKESLGLSPPLGQSMDGALSVSTRNTGIYRTQCTFALCDFQGWASSSAVRGIGFLGFELGWGNMGCVFRLSIISKVTWLPSWRYIRGMWLRASSDALCGIRFYIRETKSCSWVVTHSFLAVEEITAVNHTDAYPSLALDKAERVDGLLWFEKLQSGILRMAVWGLHYDGQGFYMQLSQWI